MQCLGDHARAGGGKRMSVSQRGRTITHAHYFDLGNAPLPAVQADDDALQAEWIPVGQIAALEAEFFEDHFHMLDHFLQITGLVGSAG